MSLKTLLPAQSRSYSRVDISSWFSKLSYQLYTLWLFTESDTPTFVLPNTMFGLFGSLAGQYMIQGSNDGVIAILLRLPQVLLFNWSNLLVFDLANQCMLESVLEDKINKPWRPVPSGRLNIEQARRIMSFSIPLVLFVNILMGTEKETIILFGLTWLYNDMKGGDGLARNVIIAIAFAFYNLGSLRLSAASGLSITQQGYGWIAIVSGVILTTMQSQDLKDQEGDAMRDRRTLPLVMGDGLCRWVLSTFIVAWSCFCAFFWTLKLVYAVCVVGLGGYIAARILTQRYAKADARSWRLWCLWTAVLYTCPLLHSAA